MLAAFIAQFYDDKPPPPLILFNHELPEQDLIAEALTPQGRAAVEIAVPKRGEKHAVVQHAETNAREALERGWRKSAGQAKLLDGVAELFGLAGAAGADRGLRQQPHHGHQRVGVMIVAGPEGFMQGGVSKIRHSRRRSRRAMISRMMREVLERRFGRALKESRKREPAPTGRTWC